MQESVPFAHGTPKTSTRGSILILEAVGAGLTAALIVLACSWPLPAFFGERVLGASQNDFYGIAWGLDHVARSIASGRWPPLQVNDILWPSGATLLVADLPEAILLTPFTLLWGALVSFNLLQIAHISLAAAAAWWCARTLGASRGGSSIAAASFAFAPVLLGTTFNQNPDVTAWYWVPLTAGLASSSSGPIRASLAALCVGMAAWCNPYGGVMAACSLMILLPLRPIRVWISAMGTMLLTAGSAALIAWATVHAANAGVYKGLRKDPFHGIASLPDLFNPAPFIMVQRQWGEALVAHWSYLGILLFILGMLAFWHLRTWRLAGLAATGVFLAMGPKIVFSKSFYITSPYAVLEHLPGLNRMLLNHRYTALAVLALGLGAALLLSHRRFTRWAWVFAPLLLLEVLFIGRGTKMLHSQQPFEDGSCELLRPLPSGPVIDLPASSAEFWIWAATCHHMPVAEGINQPLPVELHRALAAAAPGTAMEVLNHLGYRYLVLHDKVPRNDLIRFRELMVEARDCPVISANEVVRVIDIPACPKSSDQLEKLALPD